MADRLARSLDLEPLRFGALPGKSGRVLKIAAKSGLLSASAAALLAMLPLGAGAQAVDVPWRPAASIFVESVARPLAFDPDAFQLKFVEGSSAPLRFSGFPEDSEADRAHRSAVFAQCALLQEIRCWTVLDVLAGLPNGMLDWAADVLRPEPERDEVVSLRSPVCRTLLPRIFACPVGDATVHPFDDLVVQVLYREQKYFSRFQDAGLTTIAAEEGLEDIDTGVMMRGQQKVFADACRKMYFGRYSTVVDARFRSEAFDFTGWHPVDFVAAPTAVAGYMYLFGWEQRFNVLGLKCSFQVEPVRDILEGLGEPGHDLVSATGLEVGVGNFPLKAIISVGIMDGDALIDFVGIGTSLGKARQAVARELSSLRDDR